MENHVPGSKAEWDICSVLLKKKQKNIFQVKGKVRKQFWSKPCDTGIYPLTITQSEQ